MGLTIRWGRVARRCLLAASVAAGPRMAVAQEAGANRAPHDVTTTFLHDATGLALDFNAEVATMRLADPKGAVQAEVVTTAYLLNPGGHGAQAGRPVTFVINGGPGSASAWLNLGAIGPWRVALGAPSGPAVPVANAETWLPFTDLVFIDPPGTGFSRVLGDAGVQRQFYSVGGDIDALAVVMRRWLEGHNRTLSKTYIVGESYGGFRGPKLARALLDRQGVGVSGLVLISPVLDFNGRESRWNPLRLVGLLPSMAAAHRGARDRDDVADVERYAEGEFLRDLLAGEGDRAAVDRLTAHVAAATGLDPALVRERAGRIDIGTFLRRSRAGEVASPYDATVSARDPFPAAANDNSPDPILDGLRAPVTAAMLFEYHAMIGWQPEGAPARQYELLNGGLARDWDYGRSNSRPEAFTDLRQYVALDPNVRVVVAHGLDDLVTPYFADAMLLRQAPQFGAAPQIRLLTLPGGHMFYTRDDSRAALFRAAKEMISPAEIGQ